MPFLNAKRCLEVETKPQGFTILDHLCYLHTHSKKYSMPGADEIAAQLYMSVDMAMEQFARLNRRGPINEGGVPMFKNASKNFFPLTNELFFLNTGHGTITVYAYLLYCEDYGTHQCIPFPIFERAIRALRSYWPPFCDYSFLKPETPK